MQMILVSPVKLLLPVDSPEVRAALTFTDRSVEYLINKHRKNYRWARSNPESHIARMEALKAERKKCLLFLDEGGQPWTYSGLWRDLQQRFHWELVSSISYPQPRITPWAKPPVFELRPYQKEAVVALLEAKHGGIALPTGSGKSACAVQICKQLGLKTIVMTPSANITDQLYREFLERFGSKLVGKYGDGSKKTDKLFTICTGQALTRIEPGSEAWENLRQSQVFIADESHTVVPATFERVCTGVAANAPYRFFISATQVRTDGSEMVLRGITGPIVYEQQFRDLVKGGFLAEPLVKIFHVPCARECKPDDPQLETRNNLFLNQHVNSLVGQITEKAVKLANRQVLILVDEFAQFMQLRNYLNIAYEFAHGAPSDEAKEFLPQEYWKCDVEGSVARFNSGECRVLIGTGAISTGVDLKPVGCLIYLQGGTSEIQVKQSLGRGTRPVKKDFWLVDFKVMGSPTLERHLDSREEYYREFTDVVEHYG